MKIKKVIIILTILAVILMCILLLLSNYLKQQENTEKFSAAESTEIPEEINEVIQEVNIRNNFYAVKNCISKFYTYYSEIFKDPTDGYLIKPDSIDTDAINKERIEKVYKLLDEQYLNFKGITLENLSSKLSKIGDITITINKMYVIEKEEGISVYFAYGNKKDSLDSKTTDFSIMVKMDMKNRTYKILLDDYLEANYAKIEIGQEIEVLETEIKNETYNAFTFQNITDEEYVNDLFTHYKNNLRASKDKTYDMLTEDYKNKAFENKEEYLSYINENYSKIVTARLDSYNKDKNSEYTQYIFKDLNGNYYIFNETGPFKYTVMLDNYTIPTEDFIKEYTQNIDIKKVILNIKRFFMSIDDKNYGYSYSVLSDGFKSNKFSSKESFIDYAKQNFFEKNEIEYVSYEKENGVYIYKIKLTDSTGNSEEVKEFNIIVKLNNEANFEMSFGTN